MPLVSSSIRDYLYHIPADDSDIFASCPEKSVFIVDQKVYSTYVELFNNNRIHENFNLILIPVSESVKDYFQVGETISRLIQFGVKRDSVLVAVGGGIIQDITCFIAQILFRGIEWIFFPTTFLAQADSCIGSKSSINFCGSKNQLGGFYPPSNIFIFPFFLDSLSSSDYYSGLGEIAHYFLLDSQKSFEFFESSLSRLISRDTQTIKEAVLYSLEIKKAMIEIDEFDKGPRLVFNYGHSFGHSIESSTDHRIPHGIAVVLGMLISNHLSIHFYQKSNQNYSSMQVVLLSILNSYGELTLPASQSVFDNLISDKKNTSHSYGIVLSKGVGDMTLEYLLIDEYSDLIYNSISETFEHVIQQS